MWIDLSCPAEIFRTAPPSVEIPAATLTLYNLSDRVIASAEVSLRMLDASGEERERLSFRGRALNGRPHSTFLMTVPCAASEDAVAIDATIEKVWFADNDTWRRNPANLTEYTPNALPVSPALTNLKYVAGETAVGFPSRQNGLWVCLCGRPNPEESECCARCGQDRDTIFSRYTPGAVDAQVKMKQRQLDLSSRNMREDTIRLQRLREEEYRQRKKRRGSRLRILIAVPAALALIALSWLYAAPWSRLLAGRRALSGGRPADALEIFASLGSFGDAEALAEECEWQLASAEADSSRSAEALAEASARLRAIDRPEAQEKANETDLLRARLLHARGLWREAREALAPVPDDYPGKAELERKCVMSEATSLKNKKEYARARTLFLSLGEYPGAREAAADCLYLTAKDRMSDGDWDGAIEALSAIPDYRDSRSLTLQCHYRKAEALEADGDKMAASGEYLLAGSWKDAAERSRNLIYELAEECFADGDVEGARSLCASIPDHAQAAELYRRCCCLLARKAINDMEYTRALELLSGLSDEDPDTAALRAEATYMKARDAIRQQRWDEAADLLASLDRQALRRTYKDIEDLYLQACREAGRDPYPPEGPSSPENGRAPEDRPVPELPADGPEDEGEPENEGEPEGGTATPPPAFLVTEDDPNE